MTSLAAAKRGADSQRIGRTRILYLLALIPVIVWGAGIQPGLALLVTLTVIVAIALFLVPKLSMVAIGVYLLIQPALVNVAGSTDVPLGLALQRLHQGFIVAGVFRIGYFIWLKEVRTRLRRWLWFSVAFLASGFLSAFLGEVPIQTAAMGAFLALKFQVFLLVALTIPWNEQDRRRIVRAVLWMGPLMLVAGIVLKSSPPDIQGIFINAGAEGEGFYTRGDQTSMQGIMTHPGAFGWAMAVIGCYAIAALLTERRPLGALSLGTSVAGILGSLRRKPLVALPVAALFAMARFGRGRARWRVLLVLAFVAVGIVGLESSRLRATYEDTVSSYLDPYSPTAPRVLLYLVGLEIGADRFPLGTGFGRYGGYASRIYYSPVYDQYGLSSIYGLSRENPEYIMDTYWPHILGETGWLGVMILLAFFGTLVSVVARRWESPLPGTRMLAAAASMVLIEALVENMAAPIFESALSAFVVAVPLGITLAPPGESLPDRPSTSKDESMPLPT